MPDFYSHSLVLHQLLRNISYIVISWFVFFRMSQMFQILKQVVIFDKEEKAMWGHFNKEYKLICM